MNLFTKQKCSHRCKNKLMVTKGKGEGRDKLGDRDGDTYTAVYIEWSFSGGSVVKNPRQCRS